MYLKIYYNIHYINMTSVKEAKISFYYPPWNNALEPSQGNVRQWLDNLYSKFQP